MCDLFNTIYIYCYGIMLIFGENIAKFFVFCCINVWGKYQLIIYLS